MKLSFLSLLLVPCTGFHLSMSSNGYLESMGGGHASIKPGPSYAPLSGRIQDSRSGCGSSFLDNLKGKQMPPPSYSTSNPSSSSPETPPAAAPGPAELLPPAPASTDAYLANLSKPQEESIPTPANSGPYLDSLSAHPTTPPTPPATPASSSSSSINSPPPAAHPTFPVTPVPPSPAPANEPPQTPNAALNHPPPPIVEPEPPVPPPVAAGSSYLERLKADAPEHVTASYAAFGRAVASSVTIGAPPATKGSYLENMRH